MGAHPYMEATLVQERLPFELVRPGGLVVSSGKPSSQVFPDPNRNEMGRLTHPTRSSIRCAFVTFATALAAATGG